ncbi:unnamed protein product [Lampetra fluviatilis]
MGAGFITFVARLGFRGKKSLAPPLSRAGFPGAFACTKDERAENPLPMFSRCEPCASERSRAFLGGGERSLSIDDRAGPHRKVVQRQYWPKTFESRKVTNAGQRLPCGSVGPRRPRRPTHTLPSCPGLAGLAQSKYIHDGKRPAAVAASGLGCVLDGKRACPCGRERAGKCGPLRAAHTMTSSHGEEGAERTAPHLTLRTGLARRDCTSSVGSTPLA